MRDNIPPGIDLKKFRQFLEQNMMNTSKLFDLVKKVVLEDLMFRKF